MLVGVGVGGPGTQPSCCSHSRTRLLLHLSSGWPLAQELPAPSLFLYRANVHKTRKRTDPLIDQRQAAQCWPTCTAAACGWLGAAGRARHGHAAARHVMSWVAADLDMGAITTHAMPCMAARAKDVGCIGPPFARCPCPWHAQAGHVGCVAPTCSARVTPCAAQRALRTMNPSVALLFPFPYLCGAIPWLAHLSG